MKIVVLIFDVVVSLALLIPIWLVRLVTRKEAGWYFRVRHEIADVFSMTITTATIYRSRSQYLFRHMARADFCLALKQGQLTEFGPVNMEKLEIALILDPNNK